MRDPRHQRRGHELHRDDLTMLKRIQALRAKTVERGATEAEAAAAQAKADELENGVERAVLMQLKWAEEHARRIVWALAGLPSCCSPNSSWRWPLLRDWASVHGHLDVSTLKILAGIKLPKGVMNNAIAMD
jgi:hypothetical protein